MKRRGSCRAPLLSRIRILPGTIRATDNELVDNGHVKFDNELVHYHLFLSFFFSSLFFLFFSLFDSIVRRRSKELEEEEEEGLDKASSFLLRSTLSYPSRFGPSTSVERDNETTRGCHPPCLARDNAKVTNRAFREIGDVTNQVRLFDIGEIVLQRRLFDRTLINILLASLFFFLLRRRR